MSGDARHPEDAFLAMLDAALDDPITDPTSSNAERPSRADPDEVAAMKRRLLARIKLSQALEASEHGSGNSIDTAPPPLAQPHPVQGETHRDVERPDFDEDPFAHALMTWSRDLLTAVRTATASDGTISLHVDNETSFEALVGRPRRSHLEPWPVLVMTAHEGTAAAATAVQPPGTARALSVRLGLPESPHAALHLVVRLVSATRDPVVVTALLHQTARGASTEFVGSTYVPAPLGLDDVEAFSVGPIESALNA